jgi:hypothetical protein
MKRENQTASRQPLTNPAIKGPPQALTWRIITSNRRNGRVASHALVKVSNLAGGPSTVMWLMARLGIGAGTMASSSSLAVTPNPARASTFDTVAIVLDMPPI